MDSRFDDIRPYFDSEVPKAVERMLSYEYLPAIAEFLRMPYEQLKSLLHKCKSVDNFQDYIMASVVTQILKNSAKEVTFSGLHFFEGGQKHLIITNHRDIVLDSAIIQLVFHNNGVKTTEIAVGDNLISSQFIEDVARSNKMIKVTRSSSPREVYNASKLMSEYIRGQIESGTSSIWIAQRQGRTKDGIDQTEQGLLKMLSMSGKGDFEKDMNALSILPIAISYEFEPCDIHKAYEVYVSRRHKYEKGKDEDFISIVTGMTQWKGNIHLEVTDPITPEEIMYCAQFTKNERFTALAKIIDKQIHNAYKLWPNNYIAADLLSPEGEFGRYSDYYSPQQKKAFIEYIDTQIEGAQKSIGAYSSEDLSLDKQELKEILLGIYANPLFSKESYDNPTPYLE